MAATSTLALGRAAAVASALLVATAFDACAEGESFDDSQITHPDGGRRTGAAGSQAGTSNGASGSSGGDTSGSGGAAGAGGVSGGGGASAGLDASAGTSNGGSAGTGGSGGASGSGGGGASGSGGKAGSAGASGAAGTGGAGGSMDAGAAGSGGTGGTVIVSDAGPTCDYSKAPLYALIANQGNGGPNPTDNVIQFDLKVVNTTANPVPFSNLKVRYYFTDENAGPSTTVNFFSKIDGATYIGVDAAKVYVMRYDLAPTKTGANAYLEFTFDPSLGSLPANDYVWARAQFHHNDYRVFNENDDYSYLASNSPADEAAWEACKTEPACPTFANCKTVVLQDTTVVFGTPP